MSIFTRAVLLSAALGLTSASAQTTVTLMTWEGASTNALIRKALDQFSKANPDIKIEMVPSPNSGYDQKIQSMILARKLPDLFWIGNDKILEFGGKGLLYDWSKAALNPGDLKLSNFAPGALEKYKLGGKLYGLPSLMNTYGYFYNADLFTASGVPLPKPGWTYTQFYAAAKALSKNGKYAVVNSTPDPFNSPFLMSQYSLSAGGAAFQDRYLNPSKVTASTQFIEGTTLLAAAIKSGYIAPPSYATDGQLENFLAGNVPMLGGGQWLAAGMLQTKPKFKVGFVPLPQVKVRAQPFDAVGIAASASLKNPDAAWKVMTWLDSKGWESILPGAPVAPSAYVPSATPYFNTLKAGGYGSVADSVKYVLGTTTTDGVRFVAPWSGKANDQVKASWSDILLGKVAVQPGVTKLVEQLNTLISDNK
ncbi:ABC transporter substrate-binding protein [Deinococcus sp.]|uniref:ABC transporter substrate-binding protein n=1 Tax=Deinococcus sp. TaxID=47478 RepID=UPI003B5C6F10